jgi:oligopeptide transport system permease protein
MNTRRAVITDISQAEEGTSLWQDAWVRLRKNHLAVLGLVVLCS